MRRSSNGSCFPLLDKDLRPQAKRLFSERGDARGLPACAPHSDLGPSHLLVRDGRLAGVIDWGDARVGDPAIDYAWLLNGPFPDWDVDDELRRRARIYHRLGPWFEVHYGLFTNRPANTERGLAGIRDSARQPHKVRRASRAMMTLRGGCPRAVSAESGKARLGGEG